MDSPFEFFSSGKNIPPPPPWSGFHWTPIFFSWPRTPPLQLASSTLRYGPRGSPPSLFMCFFSYSEPFFFFPPLEGFKNSLFSISRSPLFSYYFLFFFFFSRYLSDFSFYFGSSFLSFFPSAFRREMSPFFCCVPPLPPPLGGKASI